MFKSSASKTIRAFARAQEIRRAFSSAEKHTVTLFPGDGIGPEISAAVQKIFTAAQVPIQWETYNIGSAHSTATGELISKEALDSVRRNKVALKGPLATPIGKGHVSLNLTLRKALQLYANVRPALSVEGVKTQYDNVDLVTIRENTEGEYSGLEHEVVPGVTESIKVITRAASTRIAEYAFAFAVNNKRKKVTAVHKANIMKLSDGLFLQCCREVAAKYEGQMAYDEHIVDAACMNLVRNPANYDVMVLPNLYGDIVSDLASGLVGGLGLTPSANHGQIASLFEAVHGTAPDIAGQNKANPTALLLSGVMMLRHMKLHDHADSIHSAVMRVFKEGKVLTPDLKGKSSTDEFTAAIIANLKK